MKKIGTMIKNCKEILSLEHPIIKKNLTKIYPTKNTKKIFKIIIIIYKNKLDLKL